MARSGEIVPDPNLTIGGLDLINDNLRMLLVNRHVLPAEFLGSQMIHVLDYLLKWRMAFEVERRLAIECGTWDEILVGFSRINDGNEFVSLIKEIREIRLKAAADLVRVEGVTRWTIALWTKLTKIRMEKL